jgi:hypothetical protein
MNDSEKWLGEILAVLHKDGGHYLGEHGAEQATQEALKKYYVLVKDLDRYRIALHKIAGHWEPARMIAKDALDGMQEESEKRKAEDSAGE